MNTALGTFTAPSSGNAGAGDRRWLGNERPKGRKKERKKTKRRKPGDKEGKKLSMVAQPRGLKVTRKTRQ